MLVCRTFMDGKCRSMSIALRNVGYFQKVGALESIGA